MEETGRNGEEMERTLVWGHRGASGYAPENTMATFEKAVELGADGIELDVRLTKDGELVVIHDETIDRVSDGSGWVKDYTYAKLIKHNFNRTHPEYEHAQIPTLEEVYALIKPTDLTINVEIKTGVVFYPEIEARVLDLTERMGLMERVIFPPLTTIPYKRSKRSIRKQRQECYTAMESSIRSVMLRMWWERMHCTRHFTTFSMKDLWKSAGGRKRKSMYGL